MRSNAWEENRVLREQLSARRLRFTDDQRRRLAAKAKALCRENLKENAELVTPDTLLRWYRELIAAKYEGSQRRGPGRPRMAETIRELVLTMAKENSSWGYTRVCGALANMGHEVGRNTVKRILAEHGIEPAPARDKRTPWSTFLKAHWGAIAATDFFAVEVLTTRGLIRYFVLFVIDLKTRRVEIAGIVHQPYDDWMKQIARKLDGCDGWISSRRSISHPRSRPVVLSVIPRHALPCRGGDRETTRKESEFERSRGAFCSFDKTRVPQQNGSARRKSSLHGRSRLRRPLPSGKKSPGSRQQVDLRSARQSLH